MLELLWCTQPSVTTNFRVLGPAIRPPPSPTRAVPLGAGRGCTPQRHARAHERSMLFSTESQYNSDPNKNLAFNVHTSRSRFLAELFSQLPLIPESPNFLDPCKPLVLILTTDLLITC